MQFDPLTVLTLSSVVVLLLGCLAFFAWRQDRRSDWLSWWGVAFFFGFGSIVLNALRGLAPDILTAGLGTALLLSAAGFIWLATRVFGGRPARPWTVIAVAVLWLGLFLIPPINQSLAARVVIASLLSGILLAAAAGELWRDRAEALPSRGGAVLLLGAWAAFLLMRVPMVGVAPFPFGGQPLGNLAVGMFNLLMLGFAICVAFMVVALTKERAESTQRHLAQRDQLTGLGNRRAVYEALGEGHLPPDTALVVFDLDRFKSINDRYGHAVGDDVLRRFAKVCVDNVRRGDLVARLGGEEFALVLRHCAPSEALEIAERIRDRFSHELVPTRDGAVRGTVSAGIAIAGADVPMGFDDLLRRADRHLYEAKNGGRNRVGLGKVA